MRGLLFRIVVLLGLLPALPAQAERITVAVAANFLATARALAAGFSAETGTQVALVHGATGALYAQINAGAPFDLFLAADAARPERLQAEGRVAPAGRRAYALGRLALVGRDVTPEADWRALLSGDVARLAIANPQTAPYGVAAREVLSALRGRDAWDRGVVYGDSVGQAFAFVATGNAGLGLVALAQARTGGAGVGLAEIPPEAHAPIRQEAVLLARAAGNAAAREFFDYLASDAARAVIAGAGYGLPAP